MLNPHRTCPAIVSKNLIKSRLKLIRRLVKDTKKDRIPNIELQNICFALPVNRKDNKQT